LDRRHWAAVVEVGTNHPGELRPLLDWVRPQYGVFTGVGREHLEFFGDEAGVAREEGLLAEMVAPEGLLVLNGDDPWADSIAARSRAPVVRVGLGPASEWRATALRGLYEIRLVGAHQARNALLALAMGAHLGLEAEQIRRGLAQCAPAPHRMESFQVHGVWVLDDCYNANPDSMRAALETFCRLPCAGRRVAVLGEMAELGPYAEAAHAEVGQLAAALGVEQLFAVGAWAGVMASAARAQGLLRVLELAQPESVAGALRQFLRPGDAVLIKGSRRMRLEQVVEALRLDEARAT